ncbi:MAG: glycosyltransferase [Fibrobacterota bacterium]
MNRPRLSIAMIVKDEAPRLPVCLNSVKGLAQEMVVVDTGSADGTPVVAQAAGARVVHEAWQDDFSLARNRSLAEVTGDWVLWLDADDVVPVAEHDKIRALLDAPAAAYSFIIENRFEGRSGQLFRQVRLFPNNRGLCFEGRVHEGLSASVARAGLSIVPAEARILHTGYDSGAERMRKQARNHALLESEYREHPDEPVVLMELGNSHFQQRDYDRAIDCYKAILTLPGGAERRQRDVARTVPVLIGTAYYDKGDPAQAQLWFEQSVSRYPEKIAAYHYLGQIALRKNDPDTLLAMAEKVIALPAEVTTVASDITGMKANAYAYAANLHLLRNNPARALELFVEADHSGLPVAFRYEAAVDAAQRAGRHDLAEYFSRKT